jgi:hypothetical protein
LTSTIFVAASNTSLLFGRLYVFFSYKKHIKSNITNKVNHDANVISKRLDAAVADRGSKKAFKTRINLIKTSYEDLGAALEAYVTNTNGTK